MDDPELLYRQLGQLVADIPRDLSGPGAISPDTHIWLGRAALLVGKVNGELNLDTIGFTVAVDHLDGVLRENNAHQIVTILYRALARAEQNAPAAARGAFIPVRAAFTVIQVIGQVVAEAKSDVLIVDAYMGLKTLTDFAPLVPERVTVRLLTDSHSAKPEILRPALERWGKQYGASRPLEIRLTAPRLLHDRLIIIDHAKAWSLTQSLEHFGDRSPATVLRVEGEAATAKIHAYEQLWNNAQPL